MTNFVTRKLLTGFIFAFVLSFAFTPVLYAQIDEIIVTARKRDENLQEVPIAITALSAQTIEERQLFTVTEVAQYVPNLQYSVSAAGVASSATFTIRGIGQPDFITTTDSGVGVYLDGVYLARVQGSALDLADVERVEVLRGPQGTLFGRNTIGGAVSVVTRKPSDEFGVRGHLTVGNNARVQGRAIVDVPLIDGVLASKFTVVSKTSDGFGRDIEPLGGQGNLGEDDDIAGRAQFLWTPSDRAEFDLAVEYSDRSGTAVPQARIFFDKNTPAGRYLDDGGTNSVIGHNRNFKSSDLEKVTVDTPMLDELEVFGIALVANFEFDGMTLKSITAYRDQEAENGQDFDGGRTPTINQTVTSEQEQFSQEFQLTGQTENGKMDWLLGAYYFEEEGTFITDVQVLFPTSTPAEPLKFGAVTPLDIDTDNETESYAAFAQANYQITDKLSIAGGVRYTEETKSILINTVVGGVTRVDNGRGEQTFDAVTPKLSIDYQVHDDLLIYASIAQGFRSGGYNGRAFIPNQLAPFTEETSTSYELGFKSDLFENRLRFNLAGFLNEYEDIQLTATATDALGGLIVTTANAGDMDLWGFEVEIEALPTENLTVFSSVGYVTSDQLKPKPGFRFQATTLPLASKWTVNVGTEYVLPMNALFGTKLGIDYAYQSGFFPQFDDSPLARQEGYGLLNARVQFTPQNEGNWTLTLWGKNIRDKVYRTAGQDAAMNNLPVVVGFFGPTREYGATFAFSF